MFHVCVFHPCSVFLAVYSVLCLFYLTSCVCVCHLSFGPSAWMPWSQARLGFLSIAPQPVPVPSVLGALVVWIQKQNKKTLNRWLTNKKCENEYFGNPHQYLGRCVSWFNLLPASWYFFFQISIDILVLKVPVSTFRWKETMENEIGNWDQVTI